MLSLCIGSPRDTVVIANVSHNAVASGENVALQCLSRAFSVPVCRFYRERNVMNASESEFVFQNFTAADQGEYYCNCSNIAGVDQATIILALYGE